MRKYAAEFVATFILVFAGAGAVMADAYLSEVRLVSSFGVVGIALAHGLALALAIAALGHISGGHVNPAISIAFWITRRIRLQELGGYVVAQLAGAVAAAGALRYLLPKEVVDFTGVGVTQLGDGVGFRQGLFLELALTLFLAFVIWGVAVDKRGPKGLAPFAIGLVLTFDIIVGGPFTGAAMNPARWFGPALIAGEWSNMLVWIIGPVLGALLGALLYEVVFLGEQPIPAEEELEEEAEEAEEPAAWRRPSDTVSAREGIEREPAETVREPETARERTPPREPVPPRPDSVITPPRERSAPPPSAPERPSWERPREETPRPSWERPSEDRPSEEKPSEE